MAKTRHTNTSPMPPNKKKAKDKEMLQDVHTVTQIQHICRTCLEEIQASSLIPLNDSSSNIRNELRACIPEVDFDLVPNAGMCTYCLNALHVAYEFKQRCLQTEDKIRKQLHRKLLVDLTKLKKTNNIVQVSNGDGLGLDVVYINDPIELIDGEIETVDPFSCTPKNQISTPLLDEEIEMINSSVNGDNMEESSISVQEDNEHLDEEIVVVTTNSSNKKLESNILLGVSESAPRKLLTENEVVYKKKKQIDKTNDLPVKLKKAATDENHEVTGMFECVSCMKSIQDVHLYIAHVKQHKNKKYKCNACNMEASYPSNLLSHLKYCKSHKGLTLQQDELRKTKAIKRNEYRCPSCKFSTTFLLIYKKHTRVCLKPKKQKLEQPKVVKPSLVKVKIKPKTKDKISLLKKIKTTDTSESPTPSLQDSVIAEKFGNMTELLCRHCGYTTKDSAEFERHARKSHKSDFAYSCKDLKCYFVSRTKQGLISHMMQLWR